MTGMLKGIRVIELGRVIAAPYAAQLLGDLGAEVIKIEQPVEGDMVRDLGPPFLKDRNGQPTEKFYARSGNSSQEIPLSEMNAYIKERFHS